MNNQNETSISRNEAAKKLGSIKTEKKAQSSAENGKKGGRPTNRAILLQDTYYRFYLIRELIKDTQYEDARDLCSYTLGSLQALMKLENIDDQISILEEKITENTSPSWKQARQFMGLES